VLAYHSPGVGHLVRGDRVVVVRPAEEQPWAPRPGTSEATSADEPEDGG
jgi:voltage-gated potassium channel